MFRLRRQQWPVMISLLLLLGATLLKTTQPALMQRLQHMIFDSYQQQLPRVYQPAGVKIIDIDDESLKRIGQWPWPRITLARLVNRLAEAGSGPIAFDMVFAEADRTSPKNLITLWGQDKRLKKLADSLPDHDTAFAESFTSAYGVLGFAFSPFQEDVTPQKPYGMSFSGEAGDSPASYIQHYDGAARNLPLLEEVAEGQGFFSTDKDADGIIRRIPLLATLKEDVYFSLSMEALRVAQGAKSYHVSLSGASGTENNLADIGITHVKNGKFVIPTDKNGNFLIYFTEFTPDRYIPAWKILDESFNPASVEGQILFVGTSAAGLQDLRATPLNPQLPGVELHAQAVEQILLGHYLYRPGYFLIAEIIGMLIGGLALMIVMARLTAIWGACFMLVAQAASMGFSWWAFTSHGWLIDPVFPSLVIFVLYLSESLRRYLLAEKERKQVRTAFAQYMSPALVEELAKNPDKLVLGGQIRPMTVLFCDIRGFTTISERYDAEALTLFINRFLTPMTEVILRHEGTIDKYMGDCIMAFWNAPLDDRHHARHACEAALAMLSALNDLNAKLAAEMSEQGKPHLPISIGIGVNSGDICVGNMGSDQRFDYSVLGDDVNLASRLEGQSKTYGVDIVLGEATAKQAGDLALLELDFIRVKGKAKAVTIYALFGDNDLLLSEIFQRFNKEWHQMLEAYRARQWDRMEHYLELCRSLATTHDAINHSGLFDCYQARLFAFRVNPPSADWDGVYEALAK